MPLQNKVDPFGNIKAENMRGLFMGNRGGRFHDPKTRTLITGKTHASRRWISCLIDSKGRQRSLMSEDSYTELFFLDEVVALAAGHRPCAECRRTDYNRFRMAVGHNDIKADELDFCLHDERTANRITLAQAGDLPEGVVVGIGPNAYARKGSLAFPFTFAGYGQPIEWGTLPAAETRVLTPATSILALKNGYMPVWHPTVGA